ncbi:GNAT family N-acetyltransferase [Jiella sonneratiae]|uniref:GNAT family N-acetyltransferase n=1 Tax=Jiella sonneratiae TaxID=2816856 RepID=A0ABS3IXL8_9HYPH|nr:GNAT family N-acetyltransferase [Jiella sonneratiae]MBO0902131.1 GNAT family N-acetyltransferase [Jiella sonneratiae]
MTGEAPAGGKGLSFEVLSGAANVPVLGDLARLRIAVFRAYPYLYDGDEAYERRYLETYARSPGAVVVIARAGNGTIVGAATAAPLGDHQPQLAEAFRRGGVDPDEVFYLSESVLLPEYRGQGAGHRFFEAREAAGRAQGRSVAAFCGVVRPHDHPAKPRGYQPLDAFWTKRGYRRIDGLVSHMRWRDIGETAETDKPMQFWMRRLG